MIQDILVAIAFAGAVGYLFNTFRNYFSHPEKAGACGKGCGNCQTIQAKDTIHQMNIKKETKPSEQEQES